MFVRRTSVAIPQDNSVALDVILLHPLQGVGTMLVTSDFTGLTG